MEKKMKAATLQSSRTLEIDHLPESVDTLTCSQR